MRDVEIAARAASAHASRPRKSLASRLVDAWVPGTSPGMTVVGGRDRARSHAVTRGIQKNRCHPGLHARDPWPRMRDAEIAARAASAHASRPRKSLASRLVDAWVPGTSPGMTVVGGRHRSHAVTRRIHKINGVIPGFMPGTHCAACAMSRSRRAASKKTGVIPGFMPGTHCAARSMSRSRRARHRHTRRDRARSLASQPADAWVPGTSPGMTAVGGRDRARSHAVTRRIHKKNGVIPGFMPGTHCAARAMSRSRHAPHPQKSCHPGLHARDPWPRMRDAEIAAPATHDSCGWARPRTLPRVTTRRCMGPGDEPRDDNCGWARPRPLSRRHAPHPQK